MQISQKKKLNFNQGYGFRLINLQNKYFGFNIN